MLIWIMDGFPEYARYDALGLARLVRDREVHPRELVQAAIERIERYNSTLNAVIHKLYDRARQEAEGSLPEGPFAGVPYLFKDLINVAGVPVTFGSVLAKAFKVIPTTSHPVVERSLRAGFIHLGMTNTCEFGLMPVTEPVAHGATYNPWNPSYSPGGSSGGAAAAVAAGLVPMAQASDGGGSIRIPASACGVFGLKPSRGRMPQTDTDVHADFSIQHCVSRSVRDSAALLDVTRGNRGGDRYWAPEPRRPFLEEVGVDPGQLRIGFATSDFLGRPAHPDCVAAVHGAARLCDELGHHVEEAKPAIDGQRFNDAFILLWATVPSFAFKAFTESAKREQPLIELATRLAGDAPVMSLLTRLVALKERKPPFERLTRHLMAFDNKHTPGDMRMAWSELQRASHALAAFFERYDCFISPVLGEPPLPSGEVATLSTFEQLRDRGFSVVAYTPLCNTSGNPAMSVPLHWNAQGLPIGVHVVAPYGDEATLFRLAAQLEQARPWKDRWPILVGG